MTKKEYEINDHLGNVHVTFKDRKLSTGQANLVSYTNYYAYGTPLTGKTYSSITYSAGYNGKYKDDEVFGSTGTFYDYGERSLDLRGIPVFPSPDPLIIYQKMYPELSPYQYASNSPIRFIDIDGLEAGENTSSNKPALNQSAAVTPSPGTSQYAASSGRASVGMLSSINSYFENQMNKTVKQKIGLIDGSTGGEVKTPALANGGMFFDISGIVEALKIFTKAPTGGLEPYDATSGGEGANLVKEIVTAGKEAKAEVKQFFSNGTANNNSQNNLDKKPVDVDSCGHCHMKGTAAKPDLNHRAGDNYIVKAKASE